MDNIYLFILSNQLSNECQSIISGSTSARDKGTFVLGECCAQSQKNEKIIPLFQEQTDSLHGSIFFSIFCENI
jgi:hypothetical protein